MLFLEELNLYANAKLAKCLAIIIAFIFAGYHGLLHAMDGADTCSRLLSDGRFQGSSVWQPYGCMLHSYNKLDVRRCMRYVAFLTETNNIIFIGDSRIRQIYHAFTSQVASTPLPDEGKGHEDLHYLDKKAFISIEFFWRPNMNIDAIRLLKNLKKKKKIPKLIVLGSGTHTMKQYNGSVVGVEEYKSDLISLAPALDYFANRTKVLWMLQDAVVEEKLSPDRASISNEQINIYNAAAHEIFHKTNVHLWSSSRLISQASLNGFRDGLHINNNVIVFDIQILLNLYCNDHLKFNDGTCCSSRETSSLSQIIVFILLCSCSVFMLGVSIKRWLCTVERNRQKWLYSLVPIEPAVADGSENPVKVSNEIPSTLEVFTALGKLGLILGYFFLCDRTNLFMKENKYYSHMNFWLPLGYLFVLGIFFTEDTSRTRILHRDITSEWKGWMQLVILVYHITGASYILPIYMHIRILVSAYLFLSGFGHFTYYWTGQDLSIVRYFQVMFRMNFLTILLCFLMNRPYQFYYFVPLISFWYTVVHVTLMLPPRLQRPSHAHGEHSPINYFYCILKFVGLGGFITVLYLSEVFFEKIFVIKLWKGIFIVGDDDIHEWWFRWKLDRYSALYGMMFGLIYQAATQYGLLDDKSGSNLFGGRMAFLFSLISTLFLSAYFILTQICTTKVDCNEIHPYIVWLPILGYIVLRNIFGIFRTRYSTFFAWIGKIALELFICQFHIWLAADTHGVLVLIPSYPVANILLTSFIFLCASHEIHKITITLSEFFVPHDKSKAVRNIVISVLFLSFMSFRDAVG